MVVRASGPAGIGQLQEAKILLPFSSCSMSFFCKDTDK